MMKLKISYYIHNLPTRQNKYFNTMNMCNLYQIIIIIMTYHNFIIDKTNKINYC